MVSKNYVAKVGKDDKTDPETDTKEGTDKKEGTDNKEGTDKKDGATEDDKKGRGASFCCKQSSTKSGHGIQRWPDKVSKNLLGFRFVIDRTVR